MDQVEDRLSEFEEKLEELNHSSKEYKKTPQKVHAEIMNTMKEPNSNKLKSYKSNPRSMR